MPWLEAYVEVELSKILSQYGFLMRMKPMSAPPRWAASPPAFCDFVISERKIIAMRKVTSVRIFMGMGGKSSITVWLGYRIAVAMSMP